MIAHLRGREDALEAFRWQGRQAEWIASACLRSGGFIRAQLPPISTDRSLAAPSVRPCPARARARRWGTLRVCRIFGRGTYRVLGTERIHHCRVECEQVRHLLSHDHVLEHAGLPWLSIEPEKAGAFETDRHRAPAPRRVVVNANRGGFVPIGECTSDTGVHVHRNAISMCAPALPYVAGCLTVAARPPERRRRSGALGRRWERPPLWGCLHRHRGGLACARPCPPSPRGVAPASRK